MSELDQDIERVRFADREYHGVVGLPTFLPTAQQRADGQAWLRNHFRNCMKDTTNTILLTNPSPLSLRQLADLVETGRFDHFAPHVKRLWNEWTKGGW